MTTNNRGYEGGEMTNLNGMPITPEEDDFYALNNLHACYSDLVVESGGDRGWDVQP